MTSAISNKVCECVSLLKCVKAWQGIESGAIFLV